MLFIRRLAYELFLKLHSLASVTLLISLWLHVNSSTYITAAMAVASSLFLLQTVAFYANLVYRNIGSGLSCRVSSKRYEQVVRIEVTLKRAWDSKSGQFLYLYLPRMRSLDFGIFESHPFMIAWDYTEPNQTVTKKVVLLAQPSNGFTKQLLKDFDNTFTILDGSYGNDLYSLKNYDTVLFMANGIGLAGVLMCIRHLIIAHND